MTEQAYEYQGLLASTWDLLRGDTSQWPDRVFYREVIRQAGEPALDVGCGTGRLLLDYMADGVDVDGVDNSPEMLALCGQKAEKLRLKPNLYEQEMASLALPRRHESTWHDLRRAGRYATRPPEGCSAGAWPWWLTPSRIAG
jgi:ubiquinone/menaquinone biosynthesis C-methylase UbiE